MTDNKHALTSPTSSPPPFSLHCHQGSFRRRRLRKKKKRTDMTMERQVELAYRVYQKDRVNRHFPLTLVNRDNLPIMKDFTQDAATSPESRRRRRRRRGSTGCSHILSLWRLHNHFCSHPTSWRDAVASARGLTCFTARWRTTKRRTIKPISAASSGSGRGPEGERATKDPSIFRGTECRSCPACRGGGRGGTRRRRRGGPA